MAVSGGGASVSLGRLGSRVTIGSSGMRATFGLPGSGLFYTAVSHGGRLAAHTGHAQPTDPISFLMGLAILWVMARTLWGVVAGG